MKEHKPSEVDRLHQKAAKPSMSGMKIGSQEMGTGGAPMPSRLMQRAASPEKGMDGLGKMTRGMGGPEDKKPAKTPSQMRAKPGNK